MKYSHHMELHRVKNPLLSDTVCGPVSKDHNQDYKTNTGKVRVIPFVGLKN